MEIFERIKDSLEDWWLNNGGQAKVFGIMTFCAVVGFLLYTVVSLFVNWKGTVDSNQYQLLRFAEEQRAVNKKVDIKLSDHDKTLTDQAIAMNALKKTYDGFVRDYDVDQKKLGDQVVALKKAIDLEIKDLKGQLTELAAKTKKDGEISSGKFDELNGRLAELIEKREKTDELIVSLRTGQRIP